MVSFYYLVEGFALTRIQLRVYIDSFSEGFGWIDFVRTGIRGFRILSEIFGVGGFFFRESWRLDGRELLIKAA